MRPSYRRCPSMWSKDRFSRTTKTTVDIFSTSVMCLARLYRHSESGCTYQGHVHSSLHSSRQVPDLPPARFGDLTDTKQHRLRAEAAHRVTWVQAKVARISNSLGRSVELR